MKCFSLLLISLFASSCAGYKHEWHSEYKKWVSKNYQILGKLDEYLVAHPALERIRTTGNKIYVSKLENEVLQEVNFEEEILRALIPEHGNMLYLSNDVGLFIGVGVFSSCNGIPCSVGVAKFRKEYARAICDSVGLKSSQHSCFEPIYKEWYIHFENRQ